MKLFILFSLSLLLLTACEKTVVLDLKQTSPKVVIEGLVTDHPGMQYVKVSYSLGFYDSGKSPRITDATVTVMDDEGAAVAFIHNPRNHPDSVGYYKPVDGFAGQIGHTYKLTVQVGSERYEGEDHLYHILSIDSLTIDINQDERKDPKVPGRYYVVKMYTKEPRNTVDYYLFQFYRNDTLTFDSETDIYYSDDKTLGENIDGIESPIFYSKGDTARVCGYSLSRQAFVFYNDLSNLLNGDGGMFSPPPANCRNNLSNGALGYFQASAVTVSEIILKE